MDQSLVTALNVLWQLQTSGTLSPAEYVAVQNVVEALVLLTSLANGLSAISQGLKAIKWLVVSAEAEHLCVGDLKASVQGLFVTVELEMTPAETLIERVRGYNVCPEGVQEDMLFRFLIDKGFLQVRRATSRAEQTLADIAVKLQQVRVLLNDLEELESLDGLIQGMHLL